MAQFSQFRSMHRGRFIAPVTARVVSMLALAAMMFSFTYGDSVAHPVTAQEGPNWIHYKIDGDATDEKEEKDVVMCSTNEDGFLLRSPGEWTIGIESTGASFGEHPARFELSPPMGKYRDEDARTDDRAWADGTLVLSDGGKDSMGFSVFKGTFAIPEIASASGFSFTLEVSFSCQVL